MKWTLVKPYLVTSLLLMAAMLEPPAVRAQTVTPTAADVSTSATATPQAATTAPAQVQAAPAAQAAAAPPDSQQGDEDDGVTSDERSGDASPSNVVRLVNRMDGRFRLKGRVQLNHIPGRDVTPVNQAYAYASCTNCQTFVVALQLDLYNRNATNVAPQNSAIAINYQCNHCYTVARALQYALPVDDPDQVPDDARALVDRMNRELRAIQREETSVVNAEARVNAVISQFQQLARSLNDQRQEDAH